MTELASDGLAAVEVFLPTEEDWKNLQALVERKGKGWSKDPFMKRTSLKLSYKPENLIFGLLIKAKGVILRMLRL